MALESWPRGSHTAHRRTASSHQIWEQGRTQQWRSQHLDHSSYAFAKGIGKGYGYMLMF